MDEGLHKLPQNPALCRSVSVSKTPLYIPRCGLPTFHPLHMLERKTENSHGLLSALPVITVPFSRTSKGCFQQISFWLFFSPSVITQPKTCKFMRLCPGAHPFPPQRNDSLRQEVLATEIPSPVRGQALNPHTSPRKKL